MSKTTSAISALLCASVVSLTGGCTIVESTKAHLKDEEWEPEPNDPFEIENRFVHGFNDVVDNFVLEPTARAYVIATPDPVQECVSNVFSNLKEPVRVISHAAVLNDEGASLSAVRFLMNTTVGGFGCFDMAGEAGVEKREADIGLAARNLTGSHEDGLYIVLPLVGPSSPIDAAGGYVESTYTHPFDYPYGPSGDGDNHRSHLARLNPYGLRERAERDKALIVQGINTRAELLDATDLISEIAIDEYSFIRDAYQEQRAAESMDLRER